MYDKMSKEEIQTLIGLAYDFNRMSDDEWIGVDTVGKMILITAHDKTHWESLTNDEMSNCAINNFTKVLDKLREVGDA